MTISVVIPVQNGGEAFRRCLEALAVTLPPPAEIIVVTDGDTQGSGELAQEFGARVLKTPAQSGPAAARNAGSRAATGDIVLFVDADVLVHPDTIGKVTDVLEREPEVAALFGSYDDSPDAPGFLSQYKNLFHHFVHQSANEEASTFWAGCGAVRRAVFLALGGFDERYRVPSIEDIELGYRLKRAGHRIRLCKELQVKHLKRWTPGSLLKTDFVQRALPWTVLILRDHAFVNDLNLQTVNRFSVALTYGMLCATVVSPWRGEFLAVAGVCAIVLLLLNAPLYGFLRRKHGVRFLLQSLPWHWFYYLYSGLAFVIGATRYALTR